MTEKQDNAIKSGHSVVISNTHLNPRTREKTIKKFKDVGYEVLIKLFEITFEEAVKRDLNRMYPVGYQVISEQFEKWNKSFKNQYCPDSSLPAAIIIDIDGTLTHIDGSRHPFDWDLADKDVPNTTVIDLLHRYESDHCIILLTGRDVSAQQKTEYWLNLHNIPYDILLMRSLNDNRRGDIVKEEIFWNHIADNFNVVFAIEDTPKIVRMWQSINVPVFAIGNQYIEKAWYKFKKQGK